jgi:hypothetical protein
MIYGESGSTKTTQLYLLAKWLRDKWTREKVKKTIRLFTTDGGGYAPFHDSGMIEEGFVDVLDISSSPLLYVESFAVADGRWPDENGYRGADTDWLETDYEYLRDNIGAYFIEGFDSLANRWKGHIIGREDKTGFVQSWSFVEEHDKLRPFRMSGLSEGHYGIVMTQLEIWWNKQARHMPVEYIFVTSLVEKGKERKGRGSMGQVACYGPSSVGQAQVRQIPQWFGDCWHLQDKQFTTKDGKIVDAKVAWYRNHVDSETECEYLAKVRLMPEKLDELEKEFKGQGFIVLQKGDKTKGIEQFYQWRDGNGN